MLSKSVNMDSVITKIVTDLPIYQSFIGFKPPLDNNQYQKSPIYEYMNV